MSRTIIGLSRSGDRVLVTLDRAQIHFVGDSVEVDLSAISGNTVKERGESLVGLLRQKDPVKAAIDGLLNLPPNAPPTPLYFHVRSDAADEVSWEQMFSAPMGFCALDQRCPVGRIAERDRTVRGRAFKSPLRIVAVLSADRREPRPQLEALRQSIAASGLAVSLHVITGDDELRAEVNGPGESAELIKGTSPEVCRQIAEARPDVLHLLCHGMTVAGERMLALASVADSDAHDGAAQLTEEELRTPGSISVPIKDLVRELDACDPMLVVLAACQTAVGESGGRSFAHDLVSLGVNAVIGMRRLVDLTDTDRFCRELYPGVLAAIKAAVEPAVPGEQILEWAGVLTGPRKVMNGANPAGDAWTDPVLYVQREEQRVLPKGDAMSAEEYSQLQGKLDKLRGFLATADPSTTPEAVLVELRAAVAKVEAELSRVGAVP